MLYGTKCCNEKLSRAVVHESEKIDAMPAYPLNNVDFSRIWTQISGVT